MSDDQMSWNLGEDDPEHKKKSSESKVSDVALETSEDINPFDNPPVTTRAINLPKKQNLTSEPDKEQPPVSRWKALFTSMVEEAKKNSEPHDSEVSQSESLDSDLQSNKKVKRLRLSKSPGTKSSQTKTSKPVSSLIMNSDHPQLTPSQGLATESTESQPNSQANSQIESQLNSQINSQIINEANIELIEPASQPELKPLTISQLNKLIREQIEGEFSTIWLKGEISNFKPHTSGHYYFSLKDERSQISAVMFKGFNSKLKFKPESGMEVLVRGKVTVFEPRGSYQIFCESMEPVGAGALQYAYEQLKNKLQQEGLFDQNRKRSIPFLPLQIAIVTSPTGAAIRDMVNVLGRRHKSAQIIVVPCKVQGDLAPAEIIQALSLVNKLEKVDVCIVGRGGGSIEDLWAFNDEGVARAIAQCKVPIISAVGHEIDFTIADFVADLRAPTPSAAAELVAQSSLEIHDRLVRLERNLKVLLHQHFKVWRNQIIQTSKRLIDPRRRLIDLSLRNDELLLRLDRAQSTLIYNFSQRVSRHTPQLSTLSRFIEIQKLKFDSYSKKLERGLYVQLSNIKSKFSHQVDMLQSLSPLQTLTRGYTLITDESGKVMTQSNQLKDNQNIKIKFNDGAVDAIVNRKNKGSSDGL